jgi:hypothetical protein
MAAATTRPDDRRASVVIKYMTVMPVDQHTDVDISLAIAPDKDRRHRRFRCEFILFQLSSFIWQYSSIENSFLQNLLGR